MEPKQGKAGGGPLLTWNSGGWVLALAALLCLIVVVYRGLAMAQSVAQQSHAIGDGETVSSYRFDLTDLTIPLDQLVPSKHSKDHFRPLESSQWQLLSIADTERLRRENPLRYTRFVIPNERIVGLSINGQSRAYPLRFITWHEVVNDELGGVAICISYSPFTDSVTVFERAVGERPAAVFGWSGLMHNQHHVLYDRAERPSEESLWLPITGQAIAGPAVKRGQPLRLLPAQVVPWEWWTQQHPDTTIIKVDYQQKKMYRSDPYGPYFEDPTELFSKFPIHRLPGESSGARPKERCVIISANGQTSAFTYSAIQQVAPNHSIPITVGGVNLTIENLMLGRSQSPRSSMVAVNVMDDAPDLSIRHAFWFGWYSVNEAATITPLAIPENLPMATTAPANAPTSPRPTTQLTPPEAIAQEPAPAAAP